MLNLIIRNIESQDIESVFEMHLQLQNTLANLRPDINKKISEISDEKAVFEKNLSIKGTKCMVAEIDNNIVAFSLSYICKTLEPKRYVKRKFAFIDELFVSANYRHNGIASKLVEYLIQYYKSKNISSIELFVLGNNTDAYSTYVNLGFVTQSIRMELTI